MDKKEQAVKLNYGKTILTGFGFLATSIAWAIYDPYITKILNKILTESAFVTSLSEKLASAIPWIGEFAEAQGQSTISATGGFSLVPLFIGIIMTFDNIFGVIFQPTFGKLSDNCHSKLGKRRPFILVGAPVSALFFFYTRRSFITCIIGMVNMVAFFPTLLMDWGNWPLLIPAALVTAFGFFSCKMNDTIKVAFDTNKIHLFDKETEIIKKIMHIIHIQENKSFCV